MTIVKKFLLCLALSLFAGLAAAEYAVIVNKDLPFDSLELIEIQNIYLAKTGSFPDGSWVIPVDQEKGTPQRLAFYELVLERSESQIKSYFSRLVFTGKGSPPRSLEGDAAVLQQVKTNRSVMGYVQKSSVTSDVKVVYQF